MSANTLTKRFLLLIVLLLALSAAPALSEGAPAEGVDYAAAVHLSAAGTALRQTVTVTAYVDGDTTHFAVPESLVPGGVLKARYLAINTPECTGKIEEYGKKAAAFTKEKLSSAVSIVIESDDDHWNLDSTGGRYLVWVWYKPDEASDYRNLNIELLQNGLAVPYSASNNRYGDTCVAAVSQARNSKLNVFSGQPDPDFYYGDAVELTIRELREHPEEYRDKKVAFTGIITVNDGSSVYAEQYDAETGLYYGMPVYYGYSLSGGGLEALTVGNETRIVGSFQYYESGGVWQVTDVKYRMMKPKDPGNLQKLSEGHAPAYVLTQADELSGERAFSALATSVELRGLYVAEAIATQSENAARDGALTLTCCQGDSEIQVRTARLTDAQGTLILPEDLLNKTIDVKGIVDIYEGQCQIRVFSMDHITIQP